ncbi:3-beta hydroxysteroid dehydrogenase [Pectobacterium odoriferum]|uniref:3-beta hydroxysteroid dehydrogenase n=1 Tax=Pectobacterium odoriferum TaxID=78398 RepID=A0ABD6VNF5_9GAMM|nr:NAD(P)-dependent oxidoreductase [Pectobacterium odoriferum]MBA0186782.1 NAD(P)-dependent oxidoreductase [Pectobacterium odoriferum]POD94521.1 3-beta hydroxysteroid dehydrogenase [Pectobacterium odoriferum]POE12169.1 3-beta hydroxysteroid dehydrogenase [Pectobacterium odoriferum]POE26054.1 3-beta hydroxysteroid dehydrogenase [Pectobacterium odoriferum]POE30595.1 3-beta hydroxysteroid dehydrogenase [Pectobacterium odoriferum]
MSHIALIGASGDAGSRILKELSDRGHTVTAIARSPEKIASLPNVTAKQGDALDKEVLVTLFKGHDVVVSAVKFGSSDPATLIAAVKAAGVKRYLVVGGAGSLEIAPGQRLIDQPNFPDAYRPEASRGAAFLDLLKQENDLDWSFLSPSAEFVPGQRTGTFRLGKDTLLSNDKGSSISFEDYAVALVDEIENPAHTRQRFTVGY